MAESADFKSEFDDTLVEELARRFSAVSPGFDAVAFRAAVPPLEPLAMKVRVQAISAALAGRLPPDFALAQQTLRAAFGPIDREGLPALRGFCVWVALQYVEDHGLEHLEEALDAIEELTCRFSGEFAIRPFLLRAPGAVLERLWSWCSHANEHVRRLVSEGTRPRLPWASRLPPFVQDPSPVLALLDRLIDDPSEYVRRSVANNLNDISKDHPDRVVAWLDERRATRAGSPHFEWIARHACRGLVKAGHAGALALLGCSPQASVQVRSFTVSPGQISVGAGVALHCELVSTGEGGQKLVVDYAIHFQKLRGTSRRVFKWTVSHADPGQALRLARRHPVVPVSVRRYYGGLHEVELLVNGATVARSSFHLKH
ncbi:DNA alkylation repair protein [Aquabacterium sp. A7-Y]|uniref:DNA alkylation repair protein n=1 Tax=Aquabacterium sp. A7-Y TaxID=1349605 RepID=UPI00223CB5F3|nr:DNA alkylation repair protein [Aquabacterium sp. A7-Y]MCW7536895.1 DNA alkylation repair protein [Aquabacterium sp. A7-Y]